MDLNSKSEYLSIIRKNVYSYILTTGVVVSIILGIVSIIFISVLFGLWRIKNILYYFFVFSIVVGVINTLSYIIARRSTGRINDLANRFIDLVEKLSIVTNCDKVELLEITPIPFIAVLKQSKYYVVIKYYGFYTEVNVLDPVKTNRIEGYAPVYLRKSSEIMTSRKIDSIEVRLYRAACSVPEPLEDVVVEGVFYLKEFRIVERSIDSLVKTISSILRELLETVPGARDAEKFI